MRFFIYIDCKNSEKAVYTVREAIMKKAVLFIFCGLFFYSPNAAADRFNVLWQGLAEGDPRFTPENLESAKKLLSSERTPRGEHVLAVMVGDDITAVRTDRAGRSLTEGFVLRRISANGVNSQFEVVEPEGAIVLALRRGVRGRGAVYVPWSPYMDTRELRSAGLDYLEQLFAESEISMARVRSRAVPGKNVVQIVPRDIVEILIFVEHIDGSRRAPGESVVPHALKVLLTFGANGPDAFRYSRSHAGARGLAQFMPATYAATRRAYGEARLPMSFLSAMEDHQASVISMYCAIDSVLAGLPPWYRRELMRQGNELNLGLYVAGAYNAGSGAASRAFNRYNFARAMAPARASRMYLGKFEAVWNLR